MPSATTSFASTTIWSSSASGNARWISKIARRFAAVLSDAGAPVAGFFDFLDGEGRIDHDRIQRQAEEIGVFGVPTFVVDGEIFWGGDRLWMVREKLGVAPPAAR